MRNLSELTANELTKCLCAMAGPAENVFGDKAVTAALDAYKAKLDDKTTVEKGFSLFVTGLFPVLMGKHEADVYAIMAALGGVSVKDIKAKNGVEFMRDVFTAFVLDGDLSGIFRPGCEVRGE